MRFKCPSCDAPFDSMGITVDNVTCPNCGKVFTPQHTHERRDKLWELFANDVPIYRMFQNRLFLYLAQSDWEDGTPYGRKWWTDAGCPASPDDFILALKNKSLEDKKSDQRFAQLLLDFIIQEEDEYLKEVCCDAAGESPTSIPLPPLIEYVNQVITRIESGEKEILQKYWFHAICGLLEKFLESHKAGLGKSFSLAVLDYQGHGEVEGIRRLLDSVQTAPSE